MNKNLCFIWATLLLCINPLAGADILHGPVELPGSDHLYYLLSPCTVPEAEEQAEELGGTLVIVNNSIEFSSITTEFSTWDGISRPFWIGCSDLDEEGDWRWATGEPFTFTNWEPGRPRTDTTRNHAYMLSDGSWRDADGNSNQDDRKLIYAVIEVGDTDCNFNGIPDLLDVDGGDAEDQNANNVPDECETGDCNNDGVPDGVELLLNPWKDCNDDGILDMCTTSESPKTDCNRNGIDDTCESPDAHGFIATYFTDKSLTTPFTSRIDEYVNLNAGTDEPWPGAGQTDFAARWVTEVDLEFTGFYSFFVTSDDGIRLYIDGELLIDDWRDHSEEEVSAGLFLQNGTYQIMLEYYDTAFEAVCRLEWKPAFGERRLLGGEDTRPFIDCDEDGRADGCQIITSPELDCNENGQLDSCEVSAQDCDENGILDWCELQDNDCNGNGLPDNCEIADGLSDCQPDGVPDECQEGSKQVFSVDDGGPEYGVRSSGTQMCWLQHFVMPEAGLRSEAILVNFNGMGGATANAGIWLDPNGDGIPDDLQLLGGAGSSIQQPDPAEFQRIPINDIDLGPAGTSIFVGIIVPNVTEADFPAGLDATTAYAFGSWVIGSEEPINPENPAEGALEVSRLDWLGEGVWWSNWCLRFEVTSSEGDCNYDGIPDDCQIAEGLFIDLDENGVPDSCEDCDADGIPNGCEVTCGGICGERWDGFCGLEADCDQDGLPDICQLLNGELTDCNGNEIPDACEPSSLDCNENGLLDECEFADGTAEDCDGNGVIDICQLGGRPGYVMGTDILTESLGLFAQMGFWWCVQYEVEPGASILDRIDIAFGTVAPNSLATIVVWSDPDQDGSPRDAEVLYSEDIIVSQPNEDIGLPALFTTLDIPPLDLGPTGTRFFIGAFTQNQQNQPYPAAFNNEAYLARSWFGTGSSPFELMNLYSLGNQGFIGEWMIRGFSGEVPMFDCNRNNQPDVCDIADGTEEDINGDGRPDSCTPICRGDLNEDGVVNGADVGLFFAEWDRTDSEADLNGDLQVDGEDFGLLLINWGLCTF